MLLNLWLLVPLAVSAITAGSRYLTTARREHPAPRELVRRALVVLPSTDDQRALLRAVSRVLDADPRVEVLVIKASGSSQAVDEISSRVTVLRQPDVGSDTDALQLGAARALAGGYDAVIGLSVSHSRLARRITPLLEALDDGAHVAVGSRYVPGGRVIGCSPVRRLASRGANAALRWLTGVQVNDVTAHIRAYRRSAVEQALLRARGTDRALDVDIMLRCRHAGLRVTEVPVTAAGPVCAAVTPEGGRALLVRALVARRGHRHPAAGPAVVDHVEPIVVSADR
ncbi:hypothetical protein BH23ACT10_BH23ACT10_17010 [soil metagenome]